MPLTVARRNGNKSMLRDGALLIAAPARSAVTFRTGVYLRKAFSLYTYKYRTKIGNCKYLSEIVILGNGKNIVIKNNI